MSIRSLAGNRYIWGCLAAVMGVAFLVYLVFNHWVMPAYTLHGVSVTVPDVMDRTYEDAAAVIADLDLQAEQLLVRKPNLPRDIVIDQNPPPHAKVKPGRRIYLTVNAGDTTTVLVPKVEAFSLREAINRIMIHGLAVREVLPDSFPSPHVNTITRQDPLPGMRVPPGTEVQLWISTGLGERQVSVPEVTGMVTKNAQDLLHSMRLNYVVIGADNESPLEAQVVRGQSPAAGTSVKEGIVIRLRLAEL